MKFPIPYLLGLPAAIALGLAAPSQAVTIAGQNFDDNSLASGFANDSDLGTAPGTFFDGSGLGWVVSYIAGPNGSTGPILEGSDSGGDLIGVVNSGSPVAIGTNDLDGAGNIDGNWFHVEDADGTIQLTFDPINTAGFTGLAFGFDWAASATGYEPDDFFNISINGMSVFEVTGDALESGPFVNNFTDPTLDISSFDGQVLDVVVSFSSNAAGEDFGLDNVLISGDAAAIVPFSFEAAPATAVLLFGLGLWRRPRKARS